MMASGCGNVVFRSDTGVSEIHSAALCMSC